MKYPVRLFLADEEVEFSTPPEILFNYSETELTNPTIIKNSYSKTITIEGTPKNNRIFGHIYNLERIQAYNGRMRTGFNPLVKTDFTLYYNSSIYESGYFKLDEIRRNDNNIEYDITLYGGLGDFFYNLSYRDDGNPKELSDLHFDCENEEDFSFTINKETVDDAWEYVWRDGHLWGTINFAPCYNGIPATLSADRVLINNSGISDYSPTLNVKDFSMGITSEELTEWEAFDIRSYLQRPVLRVRKVIDACCNSENNGGYEVNLDPDFFDSDNPYYWDSWMTLPLLTELDIPATVSTPLVITSLTKESDWLYNVWDDMGNATNVSLKMQLKFNPANYSGNYIYTQMDYRADGGVTLSSDYIKELAERGLIWIQLIGYNSAGQISVTSDVYQIMSPYSKNFRYQPDAKWACQQFNKETPQTNATTCRNLIGRFEKKNGEYIFSDLDGNTLTIDFTFPADAELTEIKMKMVFYGNYYENYTMFGGSNEHYGSQTWGVDTWSSFQIYSYNWQTKEQINSAYKVSGTMEIVPVGATGTTTSYEGFYTGRFYTKNDLLTLGVTPAQFLLSYAKLYGLYFVKDTESKTIDILTRHNFYQRDNVVNINDLVDKGSDITIIPNSPKYQYYDFGLEQVDSQAADSYKKTYGAVYGTATVNTGYQYEKEHKALLDGNIFKSGVNVLEKDKYFLKPIFGSSSTLVYNGPTYVNNGFKYWYILSTNNTDEFTKESKPFTGDTINPDGLRYYDLFPKPQFHTGGNVPTDGSFVLLFYNDYVSGIGSLGYHLTDDTADMYTMNDGKPCWIMTRGTQDRQGNSIAITINRFPRFTRDVYYDNYIGYSFDLGTPLATYVPNKFVTDWQSIYSKGWKSYIEDLYDVNTRVLKCRCLLRERPNPEWLRRFYWFDNCYWRLNNIKDWNISSFGTTEMEFLKVEDISNYDNRKFTSKPVVEWNLEKYSIGSEGGIITGSVYVSNGTSIFAGDVVSVLYSDGSHEYWDAADIISPLSARGTTQVPVTLTIPANMSVYSRTITVAYEDIEDIVHDAVIQQDAAFEDTTIILNTTSFPRTGGVYTGTVYSAGNWHFEYSGWVTPNPLYGGPGATTFTLTVPVNNSGQERTGYIEAGSSRKALTQYAQ